jgi:hypothetical protein
MRTNTPSTPDDSHPTVTDGETFLAWAHADLQRLITKLALPYVDDSNPILHLDELRAELWDKVARILDSGRLASCPTRQKAFGYLKVALRNHLFSLIHKNTFWCKRNGWPRAGTRTACRQVGPQVRQNRPV